MRIRKKIAAVSTAIGRRKVAAMFGVNETTVARIRREFGVRVASRGWPKMWAGIPTVRLNPRRWPLRRRGPAPLAWAR